MNPYVVGRLMEIGIATDDPRIVAWHWELGEILLVRREVCRAFLPNPDPAGEPIPCGESVLTEVRVFSAKDQRDERDQRL
ncbi:MAG: hypothetical protein KGL39_27915 [Patescibacteria group bacterium]|nr:hypothetical protein [Patescibacteria group bacterium]